MARQELLFEGIVEHHGSFAFLLSDDPGRPDLFLKGPTLRLAMDGDRAVARLVSREGDRSLGEILRVTKRSRTSVTGFMRKLGVDWFAVPEEGDERDAVKILGWSKDLRPIPEKGCIVVVKLTQWPTFKEPAAGNVVEVLGRPREPRVRLSAVLRSRGIFEEFPREVMAEAEALSDIRPEDLEGRLDLRNELTFTIDGADAKDFDDAVSLEVLPGGTLRLGVHIADVSHYVKPDSALDKEAIARGTSVYVADRVVPMLPPRLSEQLCSLRPNEDKLTLTCAIFLDQEGEVGRYEVKPSVIRSSHRLIYEDVETMRVPKEIEETLLRMKTLAAKLTRKRIARGGLDVDMPEYKVIVNSEGRAVEVQKRPRLGAHRLIEEFMLLANEAVARELERRAVPFLRRIHENPDPARLETLSSELRRMGAFAPADLGKNPTGGLQDILKRNERHPFADIISMLTIRSLKQAKYSERPGGHFGLASKEYCHFTSPIRRYPDLQVHRALRGIKPHDIKALAESCSERERSAVDAERKSVDILRAELLASRVGETFDGVITGRGNVGAFVTLAENGATALARGARAQLGERVHARLEEVDEGKGQLTVTIKTKREPLPREQQPDRPPRSPYQRPERPPRADRPPHPEPRRDAPPRSDRPQRPDRPFSDQNRPFRDKKRPFGDRNRPPGEKKPWQKDRPQGERKPWDKDRKPGERKPWQKDDRPAGEKKPWEKRAPGERKPWQKDRPQGEKKPWEKRTAGERKPWQKDNRPAGEKKPWEKRAPGGEKKPWQKDRPAGEKKPWDKKPGERKPWDKTRRPFRRPPGSGGGGGGRGRH